MDKDYWKCKYWATYRICPWENEIYGDKTQDFCKLKGMNIYSKISCKDCKDYEVENEENF